MEDESAIVPIVPPPLPVWMCDAINKAIKDATLYGTGTIKVHRQGAEGNANQILSAPRGRDDCSKS